MAFPRAAVAGLARTAAGLLVRVPADAGSGAVSVTTSRGAGPPLDGFGYRGLGQLRTGLVAQAAPLVHRPVALLAEGGDLLLDSSLLGAVVRAGDPALLLPHLARVPPAAGGGAVYWVDGGWRLHRRELAGGAEVSLDVAARIPDFLAYLHPPAGPDRLLAFGRDPGGTFLTLHDPLTLAVIAAPVAFPYSLEAPPADLGDGQVAGVARPEAGGAPLLLAILPTGGVTVLPTGGAIGPTPVPGVALAAGPTSLGPTAAVGLEDGAVEVRSTGAGAVVLPALSPTPVAALALSGDVLVVARTADGTVTGTDLSSGATWGLVLDEPSRLAAAGGLVWIASDSSDVLTAVDGATGQVRARLPAGLAPGAAGGLGGAAFMPADALAGVEPSLLLVTGAPPALVDWRLGVLGPAGTPTAFPPGQVVADPAAGRIWVLGGAAVAALEGGVEVLRADLPAPASRAIAAAGGLLVAHADGLAFVDGAGGVHPLVTGAALPVALAEGRDGRVLYAATVAGEDHLMTFVPEVLSSGGAAAQDQVVPGIAVGAAWVDGQAWVFLRDLDLLAKAARLEATGFGAPVPRVADDGDALVSPNGRTLVTWGPGPLGGSTTLLHVWSLEPAAAFPEVTSVALQGTLAGLAYDESGERLYLVTRSPSQVLVVQ